MLRFKELPQRREAEAIALKEPSPRGLKPAISGRFNVLCPLSPMLQRRAIGGVIDLLEIHIEPKVKKFQGEFKLDNLALETAGGKQYAATGGTTISADGTEITIGFKVPQDEKLDTLKLSNRPKISYRFAGVVK
jgi:hypothetical protein